MEYETHNPKISILQTTLNSSEAVHRLMMNLSGTEIEEDEEGNIRYVSKSRALVNDKGLRDILLLISTYVDKDSKLSVLDKNEVDKIITVLIKRTCLIIANKATDWDLEFSDFDVVADKVVETAKLSLNRSLGGKEMDHAYINSTRSESVQKQDQRAVYTDNAKKSWFSKDNSSEEARS